MYTCTTGPNPPSWAGQTDRELRGWPLPSIWPGGHITEASCGGDEVRRASVEAIVRQGGPRRGKD